MIPASVTPAPAPPALRPHPALPALWRNPTNATASNPADFRRNNLGDAHDATRTAARLTGAAAGTLPDWPAGKPITATWGGWPNG